MDNIIIDDNYSTFDDTKKVKEGWYIATYIDEDSPLINGRPAYYIDPTLSGKNIKVIDKVWIDQASGKYMLDFNFERPSYQYKPKNYKVKQIKWEPNKPVNIITYPTGGYDFFGEPKLENLAFANFFGRSINGSSRVKDHIELFTKDIDRTSYMFSKTRILDDNGYSYIEHPQFITN